MRSGALEVDPRAGCQVPSVVWDSVSADASTANQSGPSSTAVRQQPEQAIDAPMAIGGSGQGAAR